MTPWYKRGVWARDANEVLPGADPGGGLCCGCLVFLAVFALFALALLGSK